MDGPMREGWTDKRRRDGRTREGGSEEGTIDISTGLVVLKAGAVTLNSMDRESTDLSRSGRPQTAFDSCLQCILTDADTYGRIWRDLRSGIVKLPGSMVSRVSRVT